MQRETHLQCCRLVREATFWLKKRFVNICPIPVFLDGDPIAFTGAYDNEGLDWRLAYLKKLKKDRPSKFVKYLLVSAPK
jgi:hypothetical protein